MRSTVSFGAVAAALCACSSGHDDLAVDGTTTTTTTTTPSHTGSGGDGNGGFGASQGGGGAGGSGGAEPPGPTELTFVNGIVDAEAIRICALGYPNGENGDAPPWPASPTGLAYAAGRSIGDPSSVVPTGVDVRLWVVGGDLSAAAGKTCAEIVSEGQGGSGGGGGGPGFVVAPLPVLPAAVWDSGKSLLLVAAGCIGGPGHSDQADKLVCGSAYGPTTPTATLVAVGMSRKTDPSHVSLQAVHASVAATDFDLKVTPGFDNSLEKPLSWGLSFGALDPKPPYDVLSADDYGPAAKVAFKTYAPNDTVPTSATLLGDLFGAGEVAASDFTDGRGFTLVAVGPYPGLGAGSFWKPFTLVLVRAEP